MAGLTKVKGSGLATGAATDSLVGIADNATSTAITIDASENVGIGTSSPDSGVSSNDKGVHIQHSNVPYLALDNTGSSGRKYVLWGNTGGYFRIYDADAAATRLEIDLSGDVKVNTGNLVIGTAGKGIDFDPAGSGAAANLLDDYEEGTWTPVIDSDAPGTGRVTTTSGAKYIKIGKQVTCFFSCNLTTLGSGGSGVALLGGLPFVSYNYGGTLTVNAWVDTASSFTYLNGVTNGSRVVMRGVTAASALMTNLSFSAFATTNTHISGSISYQID